MDDIVRKLKAAYVCDLRKPEIDKLERARIIRSILNENKWSIRKMSMEFGIPKTTIEDWLLFEKLDAPQYAKLKGSDVKETELYRLLRSNKRLSSAQVVELTGLDYDVQRCIDILNRHMVQPKGSPETQKLVKNLKDTIVRLESAMMKVK